MQLTEAATLDRKSGGAEGPAVRLRVPPSYRPTTSTSHTESSWKHQLPIVIPVFHEWSAEPQIPRFAPPDFLLRLVALANFMRLSLRERRTRNHVQRSVAGNPGRDDKKERVVCKERAVAEPRHLSNLIWTGRPSPFDRLRAGSAGLNFLNFAASSAVARCHF